MSGCAGDGWPWRQLFAAGSNPTVVVIASNFASWWRNISTLSSGRFYDMAKDGRFIMLKELPPPPGAAAAPAGPSFVVVVNWLQELKAAMGK